jgi:HEAT repeat protein
MSWTPGIDAIVERFAIETPWVRTRFAETLIGFGPDATWPLLAYVRVNQAFETAGPVAAIRTLATIGDVQAVEPLIETLRETSNIEVQVAIIDSLGLLGSPVALPSIYEAAAAENWLLRSSAVSALGGIGDIESIPTLALSLTDLNWWVRRNAAASLAQIPGGIDELYEALSGADRYGADAAAEALIDAGELVAARRHLEEGQADRHDLALLGHMNGAEKVSR